MNLKPLSTLPLLVALAAFVPPLAVEEEISFRPEKGTLLTFTFTQSNELVLDEMSMWISRNGEEMDMPDSGDVDWTMTRESTLRFTDDIVEAADGRVHELRRSFDEISETEAMDISSPEGDVSEESDGASELEGTTVVFTWDEDDEDYTVEFEDDDGDEDLLEGLECAVDFSAFLPGAPVSLGDTWEVDAEAFNAVLDPGGDLHVLSDGEEESDEENEMGEQMEDNLEGEITAELTEIREEDGVRIAVIALTVELETSGTMEGTFETPMGDGTMTNDIDITFELEGELLWNLDAGHVAGFEVEGDFGYLTSVSRQLSSEIEFEMEQEQSFEGTATFSVEVEPASRE